MRTIPSLASEAHPSMANRHAKPHRKAVVGGVYAEWGNSKILNLLGVNYLKDCMQPLPHRPHETAYEVFAGLVRVNRQYAELAPEALKLRLKSLLRILSNIPIASTVLTRRSRFLVRFILCMKIHPSLVLVCIVCIVRA